MLMIRLHAADLGMTDQAQAEQVVQSTRASQAMTVGCHHGLQAGIATRGAETAPEIELDVRTYLTRRDRV